MRKLLCFILMYACVYMLCMASNERVVKGKIGMNNGITYILDASKLTLKGSDRLPNGVPASIEKLRGKSVERLEIDGDIDGITGLIFNNVDFPELKEITVKNSNRYYAENNCLISYSGRLCLGCGTSVIPPSVKEIGNMAFYNCVPLKRIEIPASVKRIGSAAFCGCVSLSSISVPSSVMSIDDMAFAVCTSLRDVALPSSVTSIGKSAFQSCTSLSQISLPDSLRIVSAGLFFGCKSLASVSVPSSVASIEDKAFAGCASLRDVALPSSVTAIGKNAFSNCTSLSQISLPDSLRVVSAALFSDCTSLSNVSLPSSVIMIGSNAFAGCTSLSQINIPPSVLGIADDAFAECLALPIEDQIVYADAWAVDVDDILQETYKLRDSTVGLANGLFAYCLNLDTLRIPESVNAIGAYTFKGCDALRQLIVDDTIPNVSKKAFSGISVRQIKSPRFRNAFLIAHGAADGLDYDPYRVVNNKTEVFSYADVDTVFFDDLHLYPGGRNAAVRFLLENFNCPEGISKDERKEAQVSFEIDRDGTLLDIQVDTVLAKAVADELVRVVSIMPKWKYPEQESRKERYGFRVTVPFENGKIYDVVEKNASFPGGVRKCYEWLSNHIKYPQKYQKKGIQGRVIVGFVVARDGLIENVRVLRSPDEKLSAEAVRVIRLMPKWIPATQNGKPVRTRFTLPILFHLN